MSNPMADPAANLKIEILANVDATGLASVNVKNEILTDEEDLTNQQRGETQDATVEIDILEIKLEAFEDTDGQQLKDCQYSSDLKVKTKVKTHTQSSMERTGKRFLVPILPQVEQELGHGPKILHDDLNMPPVKLKILKKSEHDVKETKIKDEPLSYKEIGSNEMDHVPSIKIENSEDTEVAGNTAKRYARTQRIMRGKFSGTEDTKIQEQQKYRHIEPEEIEKSKKMPNTHSEDSSTNELDINNSEYFVFKETVNYNVQNFVCNDCGRTFYNKSVLSKHIERHAIGSDDHNCQLCKYRGTTIKCLENHMKCHNKSSITKTNEQLTKVTRETRECTICKQRISKKSNMNTHLRTHTGEKPFECTICDYRCNDRSGLKRHLRTHTAENPFKCTLCKQAFKQSAALSRHLLTHTGEKPFECTICKHRFIEKSNLNRHFRTHTGEKPYECTICKYRCNDKSALKRHLTIHTAEKPFGCTVCKQRFRESSHLELHFTMHTGENPIECTICKQAFKKSAALSRHLRTHTGEKPFECTICKHRFIEKSNLNRHFRTHTGEKQYECTICKYRCNDKSALKRHLTTHTAECPFECTVCKQRFRENSHLELHFTTHIGEKPFECTIFHNTDLGKRVI